MRRPVRIAVTSVAIYIALSVAAAILMTWMTLCPTRLPLPARPRIAAMYAPYGADLQTVAIQAADGVDCVPGTLCRNIQTDKRSSCFTESETIVAAPRVTVRHS
jgi:hypothetical protein